MKTPLVSVIMPVYNAEQYVGQAIESILGQTFTDFEFLIFDDGSYDRSVDVVRKYAEADQRIVFFDFKENQGYVAHLNNGIKAAQGEYIARMDADDISLPERLAKQVKLMEANPMIGVCGTWFKVFGDTELEVKHPINHDDIKLEFLRYNAIGHPTVLVKTSLLKQYPYSPDLTPSEDYYLWAHLSSVTQLHNIPEVLLHYRWHQTNISQTKAELSRRNSVRAVCVLYNQLGINPTEQELALSRAIFHQLALENTSLAAVDLLRWANRLSDSNRISHTFAQDGLNHLLASYVSKVLAELPAYHPHLIALSFGANFAPLRTWSLIARVRFVVKCLLRWKTRL
jgi:glycosyltransferase involved in cell wall biosynthesis